MTSADILVGNEDNLQWSPVSEINMRKCNLVFYNLRRHDV